MVNQGAILLVEDSSDDVVLIRRAFKATGLPNAIIAVNQGEEAINYLRGTVQYADRAAFPVPSLMLLDLKMPGTNGFEVLAWVREHAEWRCLPIIVLTSSYYPPDIQRAYDLGANSFLTKPTDLDEFVVKIKEMGEFWLGKNILPEPGPFVPSPAHSEDPEAGSGEEDPDLAAQPDPAAPARQKSKKVSPSRLQPNPSTPRET